MVFLFAFNFLHLLFYLPNLYQNFRILFHLGIYPLQQALFMYWLKSKDDPMLLISKLDVMIIISRTQVKTAQFMIESKNTKEYDELDEEQQKHFQNLWNDFSSNASSRGSDAYKSSIKNVVMKKRNSLNDS